MKVYVIASSEDNALSRFTKGQYMIEEDIALRDWEKSSKHYESLYCIDIPIETRVHSRKKQEKMIKKERDEFVQYAEQFLKEVDYWNKGGRDR